MINIPGYIGIACLLIAAAIWARTALKERRIRKQVTDTALCGSCDREVQLNERHVTINRHIEFMDSEKSVTVLDAETVKTYHLKCAP